MEEGEDREREPKGEERKGGKKRGDTKEQKRGSKYKLLAYVL